MLGFLKRDNSQVIHVNDLDRLLGKIELIDIREPYEYKSGSIQTAKNIPMGILLDNPEKYLMKNKTYYIICQSGGRSGRATKILKQQGYQVVNVAGGVGSYVGTRRQ
jgi:rhodanese-related sulfurtransferase